MFKFQLGYVSKFQEEQCFVQSYHKEINIIADDMTE